ncbi:MAG: hypothetical protein ACRBN8_01975 [Nannocystales bacterium]
MKRVFSFGLVALLGAAGCDGDSNGGSNGGSNGDGSSGSTSESTETNPTGETLTTTTTTTEGTSTTSGSTGGSSSTTDEATTTGSSSTTGGESSSSTGEPMGATPCQPEMSQAAIEAWRMDADNHMPTFADIAVSVPDFQASSAAGNGLAEPPQGGGFIVDPDGGGMAQECDIWAQDCDKGEKCAAWSNDGGSAWNAVRCVPVNPDPAGVGETCVVEGSGVSGIDDCGAGAMCWDVDGETNEGTCIALCEGSPEAPTCAPAGTACSISNQGVLILCLPVCNPLADECGAGQGCYGVGDVFQCAPDASGEDQGEPGDPCEFLNACDDGAGCVSPDLVPCPAGAAGCCSSFCNVDGDGSECLAGQECVPWFEMGEVPDMCLEGVGVCSLPA